MRTKTIAIVEKVVLLVAMPMARKVIPRMRNTEEILRLFVFIL